MRGDNAALALARVQADLDLDGNQIQPPQTLLQVSSEASADQLYSLLAIAPD